MKTISKKFSECRTFNFSRLNCVAIWILSAASFASADTWNPIGSGTTGGVTTSATTSTVGIGLTSPTARAPHKLTLGVGAAANVYILGQFAGTGGTTNLSGLRIGGSSNTSTTPVDWAGMEVKQSWSGSATLNQLNFYTATSTTSSSKMTILANGHVGIGTTNPPMKLEVAGGGAADGALKLSQSFLELDGKNTNLSTNGGTNNLRVGWPVDNKLAFYLSGNERFVLMSNGRVGINTKTIHAGEPISAFEVNGFGVEGGGIRIQSGYFEADGVVAAAAANGGQNNLRIGWPAVGRVGYTLEGNEVMSMLVGGQVGIGKKTPTAPLHISKVNSAAQSIGLILENETSAGFGSALVFNARNAADQTVEMARIVGEGKAGKLRFYVRDASGNGQERMSISEVGEVNVPGVLNVGSVKMKVWSIVPDYVFEKDYKLSSLEHVEQYIKENKHLPDVPSAREINNKGIDLADMNMKLLKKVEELTLHAIRQEKELKNQAEKIRRLEDSRL